jgi:hypothetical protein
MSALFKESDKDKFHILFEFTSETREFFEKFRKAFLTAFLLRHFDSNRKIKIETDASKFAISEIISQLDEIFEQ